MARPPQQLAVFAKHWTPGLAKTRLAEGVGAAAAALLHRRFLLALTRRLAGIDATRSVHFSPPEAENAFRELLDPAWSLVPQREGDLGGRMRAAFADGFAAGFERVVLIGSDTPHLPVAVLEEAFDLLETCQVVLGPATDGGYYLIGARSRMPEIFDDIAWSTPAVWHQTLARLHSCGLESGRGYALVDPLTDIDTGEDLERLLELLGQTPFKDDPILADLRTSIRSILVDARKE